MSIDKTDKGTTRLKFATRGKGNVRELVVYVLPDKPGDLLFGYAMWDKGSRTVVWYHGPFGDPERDTLGDITTELL